CIVVLPCPEACLESFRVLLLMLCGDVEVNPGPMNEQQVKQFNEMFQLLQGLNARSLKFEEGQATVIASINELKANQKSIQNSVTNLAQRVTTVEAKTAAFHDTQRELVAAHHTIERMERDNRNLKSRLSDMEDRSRRDNLIFHGIDDSVHETWSQSEDKVLSFLSNVLNMTVSHEQIARAHRLGAFVSGKSRPVIVKFESFKTKDHVLSCRARLKNNPVSVAEDFSPETRLARKRLLDYGKSQGTVFKLRYNKLSLNGKCFAYNAADDSIYELLPSAAVQRAYTGAQ
ncbi:unnamed protein product, partial [Ixodes persulcatus]